MEFLRSKALVGRTARPRVWTGLALALAVAGCGSESGMPTDPSLNLTASAGAARTVSISPNSTAGDPYALGTVTSPFSATNTIVQTFTITNTSTKVTSGIVVSLSGTGVAAYSIAPGDDGCTGRSLGTAAKNKSCTVTVTFDPSSAGTFLATLQLTLAQPKGSYTVNLSGIARSVSKITVGNVVIGADRTVFFSIPVGGGTLGFQLTNGATGSALLLDGSYTIREDAVPVGYTLSDISCTLSGGSSATPDLFITHSVQVTLANGDVSCTFTNSQN